MPTLSRSEIDQLGRRLRASAPTVEDLKRLEQVRSLYEAPLTEVIGVLVSLGLEPVSRSKTTGTMVDKLRRIPALRLSEMQDLAGTRVVVEMTRGEQDALVEQIRARFDKHRIVDRRTRPSHGYRAVHIIVKVQGRPVEIQIRTRMQDLWAQITERLADAWGRGIRYGEPLIEPERRLGPITRERIVEHVMELADLVDMVERNREEYDSVVEELGMSEQLSASSRLTALSAQIEEEERRSKQLLEGLHNVISSVTLRL